MRCLAFRFAFALLLSACTFGWQAHRAAYARQSSRVEGVVLDQTGAPVAGAEVSLTQGGRAIARMTTGPDGRFAFDAGMPGAAAMLTVSARGFSSVERRLGRAADDLSALRIVLAPAPLSEQVTVTATRTETRLGETPASVVVLSAGELSTTAASTIDDALRQVPGFQLFRRSGSRSANPTSQGVSLRGVGASGASRAVVLLDGVPLNDPFGGWVYWGRAPREAVSRVEVLRGGASNLYGSDALGGAVQIITRGADAPSLSLEASYGNQRTPDLSLFAGGPMRGWRMSLSGELFHTAGYVPVDERERGRVDTLAGSRRAALEVSLGRELSKTWRASLRGSYFGEARTNGTPLQTNRTHLRQLSAAGDWQSARFGALALRAYGGTELFDQSFSSVAADRESETLARVQRVPVAHLGLTAQWSRPLGANQTLLAGLEARFVRGASDELVFVQNRLSSLVGAGGRERTASIFAEDIVRLGSRLFLTAGARLDHWRNYRAQSAMRSVRQFATTTVNAFADRTETALSPQLSALYKASGALSFSASAYRAFRQPTLNELYRAFRVGDTLTLANENLRAERLTGGEAGASHTSLGQRLSVRATLFWMELARPIANVTQSVTPNLITRRRENLGRTRSRGLELEADARLTNQLDLSAGYLLLDASVQRFPANRALEGLRIPQVARHQLNFQLRYESPRLLNMGLQGRLAGAQFEDDQNRLRLERYFTLDALASRRISHGLELFAAAENLFDSRYQIGRTPVVTLGPPLFLRAGLRLRLGAR